jgi:hypothetical protein
VDVDVARSVLRLDPSVPLTPEVVEQAYARESWERHPSRYPDGAAKQAAEAWAGTLAEARMMLLDATTAPAADGAAPPTARPRPSVGAIIALVVGGVAVVALLIAAGILAVQVAQQFGQLAAPAATDDGVPADGDGADDVEPVAPSDEVSGGAAPESVGPGADRLEAWETYFTFPAALEFYDDGRYDELCGLEYVEGCWQSALFTEADCAALEIELHFSDDAEAIAPDETQTLTQSDVVAQEATPVVFGNDEYDYGWINDVRCTSSG